MFSLYIWLVVDGYIHCKDNISLLVDGFRNTGKGGGRGGVFFIENSFESFNVFISMGNYTHTLTRGLSLFFSISQRFFKKKKKHTQKIQHTLRDREKKTNLISLPLCIATDTHIQYLTVIFRW